ncbi:MAG: trypsin-like peptidase domain-containing protein [Odoribacteraceae bacterium]|nr:trypsin-like peptidase domain-containing protein [Odoribacteraceae bacterium]
MKARIALMTAGFGLLGGFIAFLVADTFRASRLDAPPRVEVTSPVMASRVAMNVPTSSLPGLPGTVDLREAAKMAVPAVAHVTTLQVGRGYARDPLWEFFYGGTPRSREIPQRVGIGSGVIISGDGYIVTNNHVIDNSDRITVTLDNKKEYEAKVIGKDPLTDIALLKIEEKNLPYLPYGNSDDVEPGEWVLAVGNPYNLTSTVTAGIISAKARELGMARDRMNLESFLQTDAAVNAGNSGGALVNARGELIGINTAISSPTGNFSGYAFAVPVNIVHKVVENLKEFGTVRRALLGVSMSEITPELARELNLTDMNGIYVHEAIPGGAARKAGLEKGDIIKSINGIAVGTAPAFHGQLAKYNPGTRVTLSVSRGNKEKDFEVVLQDTYGDVDRLSAGGDVLGATVEPLTPAERGRYRVNAGVKITGLKSGPLEATGLRQGHVIVKVNSIFIHDREELAKAMKTAENEGVLITAISPRGRVEYFALSLQD